VLADERLLHEHHDAGMRLPATFRRLRVLRGGASAMSTEDEAPHPMEGPILSALGSLVERLRAHAAKDEKLALSKCSELDSFRYVMGRAQTLKIIADELDLALGRPKAT
jgi:hypothetical protein